MAMTAIRTTRTFPMVSPFWLRLTFDMRGGRKWAKPACGRPLDGRVRPHSSHLHRGPVVPPQRLPKLLCKCDLEWMIDQWLDRFDEAHCVRQLGVTFKRFH